MKWHLGCRISSFWSQQDGPQKCRERDVDLVEEAYRYLMELGLNEFDKRELVDGDWLTDKHINAVNTLLRKQHPTQAGLQDPVLLSE